MRGLGRCRLTVCCSSSGSWGLQVLAGGGPVDVALGKLKDDVMIAAYRPASAPLLGISGTGFAIPNPLRKVVLKQSGLDQKLLSDKLLTTQNTRVSFNSIKHTGFVRSHQLQINQPYHARLVSSVSSRWGMMHSLMLKTSFSCSQVS